MTRRRTAARTHPRRSKPAPVRLRRDHAETLATATVDRLLHHAHVVVTQRDSYRFNQAIAGHGVKALH
ncbi:ATP-binding protein [Plantactinospora mayteni]|uniref:ATP-binding protein n=1 Tax=Plantactinospora mayteni TaxID=566021 RepID=UPI0023B2876B|nr:ATP-binding protein [Plantactinospora mayteni]